MSKLMEMMKIYDASSSDSEESLSECQNLQSGSDKVHANRSADDARVEKGNDPNGSPSGEGHPEGNGGLRVHWGVFEASPRDGRVSSYVEGTVPQLTIEGATHKKQSERDGTAAKDVNTADICNVGNESQEGTAGTDLECSLKDLDGECVNPSAEIEKETASTELNGKNKSKQESNNAGVSVCISQVTESTECEGQAAQLKSCETENFVVLALPVLSEGIPARSSSPTAPLSRRVTRQMAKEGVEGNKGGHAASMKIRRTKTAASTRVVEAKTVQKSPVKRSKNLAQKKSPATCLENSALRKRSPATCLENSAPKKSRAAFAKKSGQKKSHAPFAKNSAQKKSHVHGRWQAADGPSGSTKNTEKSSSSVPDVDKNIHADCDSDKSGPDRLDATSDSSEESYIPSDRDCDEIVHRRPLQCRKGKRKQFNSECGFDEDEPDQKKQPSRHALEVCKEGVHYSLVCGVSGRTIACELEDDCRNGTFKSVPLFKKHAQLKHKLHFRNDVPTAEQRAKKSAKRRKADSGLRSSTYDRTRGTLRARWHVIKERKLSKLEQIAASEYKAFIKSHPRPEEMPAPPLIRLFKYVLPKFQFTAWDSCADDTHYQQMKIVIKNCEKGSNDVHDWAKEVLGRAGQTQLPPDGLSEEDWHQAVQAANNLQHTFADVNKTAVYLQTMLQRQRTNHCKKAQDWIDRQNEILLFDSQSGSEHFLEEQLVIYDEWKRATKANSLHKFFDNMIRDRQKTDRVSHEQAVQFVTERSPESQWYFVDSSEDEEHKTFHIRQQSNPWRKVFGTKGTVPSNGPQRSDHPLPTSDPTRVNGSTCAVHFEKNSLHQQTVSNSYTVPTFGTTVVSPGGADNPTKRLENSDPNEAFGVAKSGSHNSGEETGAPPQINRLHPGEHLLSEDHPQGCRPYNSVLHQVTNVNGIDLQGGSSQQMNVERDVQAVLARSVGESESLGSDGEAVVHAGSSVSPHFVEAAGSGQGHVLPLRDAPLLVSERHDPFSVGGLTSPTKNGASEKLQAHLTMGTKKQQNAASVDNTSRRGKGHSVTIAVHDVGVDRELLSPPQHPTHEGHIPGHTQVVQNPHTPGTSSGMGTESGNRQLDEAAFPQHSYEEQLYNANFPQRPYEEQLYNADVHQLREFRNGRIEKGVSNDPDWNQVCGTRIENFTKFSQVEAPEPLVNQDHPRPHGSRPVFWSSRGDPELTNRYLLKRLESIDGSTSSSGSLTLLELRRRLYPALYGADMSNAPFTPMYVEHQQNSARQRAEEERSDEENAAKWHDFRPNNTK